MARKTMGELAEEAPDQAAARLDLKAREFQERALAEGLDFDLIDPDTGQKIAAKDLFDEINGDDDALARLKGCVV